MDQVPMIYYSNGTFLIFDTKHALELRRLRIIGQPLSGSHASGPHCLSSYAAYIVALEGLASFCRLQKRQDVSLDENRSKFATRMKDHILEQRELFKSQRIAELKRHNVEPTPRAVGEFDESKLRLATPETADPELASFESIELRCDEVIQIVTQQDDPFLKHVMLDLYRRGFYVTSGMKFGCDFLAYCGDPVRYHAQYAIRHIQCDESGAIDLGRVHFRDINSLQRLLHGANKVPILVTVRCDGDNVCLRYWTLNERVYLAPGSDNSDFKPIEPSIDDRQTERDVSCNKISKST